jgi:RNA polymerase sigma factor (sigma-70 family)
MVEEFFIRQLEEHKGIIMKIINLYADDPEDRKDLYQEIVYQGWRSYPRFKGDAKFSTWLYKICLNVSLTFLHKKKQHTRIKTKTPNPDHDFFEMPELSERAEKMYTCIRQLAETDRSIILLHLDGFDNGEISEITGLGKNNITVKLHRIKQQLITLLNGQ